MIVGIVVPNVTDLIVAAKHSPKSIVTGGRISAEYFAKTCNAAVLRQYHIVAVHVQQRVGVVAPEVTDANATDPVSLSPGIIRLIKIVLACAINNQLPVGGLLCQQEHGSQSGDENFVFHGVEF